MNWKRKILTFCLRFARAYDTKIICTNSADRSVQQQNKQYTICAIEDGASRHQAVGPAASGAVPCSEGRVLSDLASSCLVDGALVLLRSSASPRSYSSVRYSSHRGNAYLCFLDHFSILIFPSLGIPVIILPTSFPERLICLCINVCFMFSIVLPYTRLIMCLTSTPTSYTGQLSSP